MIKFIKSFFKKNIVINGTEYSDFDLRDMEERYTTQLFLVCMEELMSYAEQIDGQNDKYTDDELEHLSGQIDQARNAFDFGFGDLLGETFSTIASDIIGSYRTEKEEKAEQAEIDVKDDRENKQLLRLEYQDNLL